MGSQGWRRLWSTERRSWGGVDKSGGKSLDGFE